MAARLSKLTTDEMNPRQREIYDAIVARRGGVGGPFMAWLRNPELADRAQKLGVHCRFDSSLPAKLSELAILIVGRHWRAQVEWAAHAPIAQKAGLDPMVIAAIKAQETPEFVDTSEKAVYDYAKELINTGRVSDAHHDQALAELGENGLVDLVAVMGYYSLVALTLNAFAVPVPDGMEVPFVE